MKEHIVHMLKIDMNQDNLMSWGKKTKYHILGKPVDNPDFISNICVLHDNNKIKFIGVGRREL